MGKAVIAKIVDQAGMVVVEYGYDAWGMPFTPTGSLATTIGELNPFRYRGYIYDAETGLYYLRSRYYNPTWGRFVDADNMLGKCGCILGHNAFIYCLNTPVKKFDPSGHFGMRLFHNLPSIEGSEFYDMFFTFGIYQPPKVPTLTAVPKTLARGENTVGKMSWKNFALEAGLWNMEDKSFLDVLKDSRVNITAKVEMIQYGDAVPVAKVGMIVSRNITDMELGVGRVNKVIESEYIPILRSDENGYWVMLPNSKEEVYVIDTDDGFLASAIAGIEMEAIK